MPVLLLPRLSGLVRARQIGQREYPWDYPKHFAALQLWLDAYHITLPGGAAVPSWPDYSGLGRHAVQADAAKQPTLQHVSGQPVVRFNGIDDYLKAAAFAFNQPITWFAVLDLSSLGAANPYIWDGNTGNTAGFAKTTGAGGNIAFYAGTQLDTGSDPPAGAHIYRVVANGASSSIAWDGVEKKAGDAGASNPGGFTLGAYGNISNYAAMDAAEVIAYGRTLSVAERRLVERYLAWKWAGLGIALAAGAA